MFSSSPRAAFPIGALLAFFLVSPALGGGPPAGAGSAAAPAGATGEWLRVGPDRYARIDWSEVARIDVRPVALTRSPVVELKIVSHGRLRDLLVITWPETVERVRRRLVDDAANWVLLGLPTSAATPGYPRQYANLEQVSYVDFFRSTALAGDESAGLYAAGYRGTRVHLGRVYHPDEVRKVRQVFGRAFP